MGEEECCEDILKEIIWTDSQISVLELSNRQLLDVPKGMLAANLTAIDLSHNHLTSLPDRDTLRQLVHLEQLTLADNCFADIPASLLALPSLRHLNLSQNRLHSAAVNVSIWAHFKQLQIIRLNRNRIDEFPIIILHAPSLVQLSLQSNAISQLPTECVPQTSTTLAQLNLELNPLAEIPLSFRKAVPKAQIAASIPDCVLDGLFISDIDTALNRAALRACGITHILTVATSPLDVEEYYGEFEVLHIPVEDSATENLKQYFSQTHIFIDKARSCGAVLVHCLAGISRSAMFVAAYVMKHCQMDAHAAIAFVRKARPCIDPQRAFIVQLKEYEQELGAKVVEKEPPTFPER